VLSRWRCRRLLFAAFLFGLLEQHHRHQPDIHAEAPIVRVVVNQVTPPPPPLPFFQGNSLDVANEIVAQRRRPMDVSFMAAPPAVLLESAIKDDLSWLPTYPSQPTRVRYQVAGPQTTLVQPL
jgi:hypothetical protein